ncbi:MAG: Mur ligase family protein [Candidatus Paceibacterota bacterium]
MIPKAKIFKFVGYRVDVKNQKIMFDYCIEFSNREPLKFTETILLPQKSARLSNQALKNFLEPLHFILGISYFKLYCPPKIEVPYDLSKEQAAFWNTVYRKGLAELFYRNNLDPKKMAKFPAVKKTGATPATFPTSEHLLLGIGGGKDSIVAAELLRDFNVTSFLMETQKGDEATDIVMKEIGNPILKVRRMLDPQIFQPYEGSYNGHIPISAVFAFTGLLSAFLYDYRYMVVGNEVTSNFGNLVYRGEEINHQWSKSAEFESLLQDYTRKFITPDISYFSLLRSFHEIMVAQLFAEYKNYFPLFTSCNRNFKVFKDRPKSLWCGECPKCAFVFLLLSAFIGKEELVSIFKKNLFADKNLWPLYEDLLGFGTMKPFDCVGTFEESQAALFLASKHFGDEEMVKAFLPRLKNPEVTVKKVFKTTSAPTLPTPFKFLGIKSVCLLGYGREGKITQKYLKQNYPKLKIGILDQELDKDYLNKQDEYDLAIKTPGITKSKVTIPYTTATNIFFSKTRNLIIGVTGSKGKSTTASLIYHILKTAGKKVRLLGNIGNPMLEVLFEKIDPTEIFVIELSSYMLEDIEYSPNIALLLNLFPEHMDYHGGIENYYKAKRNIFKFQKTGDIALTGPFTEKITIKKKDIPLLGAHNFKNIQAAVKVARLFKISNSVINGAIKSFKPLPHRLQFIGSFKGIKFYDDAISTTPESTIMAIKTLKNIGTIFLGGEDRGYDFKNLEKILRLYKIKNIVLFPDTGKRILKSRKGFNILETSDMKEAVAFAFQNTTPGKICLLSTASPSYSIWKNFEEKGDLFQKWVKKSK